LLPCISPARPIKCAKGDGMAGRTMTDGFSLEGKAALVTGASRGIGRALAEGLARAGARVAVTARSLGSLEETVAAIPGAVAIAADSRDVAAVRTAVDEAAAALGDLDILINNAGIEQVSPSLDVDEAIWDGILDTNLKGAFFAAQAATRHMVAASRAGAILNLCSLTSGRGIPTAVPYGSSKTGLVGMVRALAAEWGPRGIRVNGIAPGYFRTAMTDAFFEAPGWSERMLGKIPLGRFGDAEGDLVGPAVFLCSDAARYVTGQVLYVDGGTMAAL
jgi:NAD(P)-dependent dehydrogenase (short-subunit alcohol dehydrogenase family)